MATAGNGAEEALAADQGRDEFKELADNAPVMIWRSGTNMLCDFFTKPWLDYTGRTMEQELGMGWAEGVHPNDYDRCVETYITAFRAREPFSMDYRLRRWDGTYRWLLDNGKPFTRNGTFAGYFGSCVEIEERKKLEDSHRIQLSDLNHHIRNILASVQGIAHQTFRSAAEARSYSNFLGRLQSMAGAYDLVASHGGKGAEIAEVVQRIAQDQTGGDERFHLQAGESVWILPKRVLALSLCLYELFSNAMQHGALSVATGRIDLAWTTEPQRTRLTWTENGALPVNCPEKPGIGLKLIKMLGREGGGEVRFVYAPDGLVCTISFPQAASVPRLHKSESLRLS